MNKYSYILIFLIQAYFSFCKIGAQTNFVLPKENQTFLNTDNIVFQINGNLGSTYQVQFSASSSFGVLIVDTVVNTISFQRRFSGNSGTIWARTKEVSSSNWSPTRKINLVNLPIGQRLWLRSDSVEISGGKVAQWYDRSGNNNHALQASTAARPVRPSSSPNLAFPAIKFDGVDDFFTGTTLTGIQNTSMTTFILLNGYSQTDNGGLITIGNLNQGFGLYRGTYYQRFTMLNNYGSNSLVFDIPDAMPNAGFPFKLYGMTKNFGVSAQMHGNGVTGSTNSTPTLVGAFSNSNYEISGGPLGKLNGEIAEVMVFDQALSTSQRNAIENYMMDRYAPPVNLGSDINSTYGFCDITLQPANQIYTTYLWSNNATSSSISINQPGSYWVQTVDVFGRISRDTINVARPIFNQIALQNEIVCFGQPETYSAPIPTGAYTFVSWSDGLKTQTRTISSAQSLSYTIQDNLGCKRTSNTAQITLDATLSNFSLGNDTSLCAGNNIGLIQNLTGTVNYNWNTGNVQSLQKVDTTGTYVLQVSNPNGCQNVDTINVVVVGVAPTLKFSITPQACQGNEFHFYDSSYVAMPNIISTILWHFENQQDVFDSSGTIIYPDSGVFNGSIEVTTVQGCSNFANFTVYSSPTPLLEINKSYACTPNFLMLSGTNLTGIEISNVNWFVNQNNVQSTSILDTLFYELNSNNPILVNLTATDLFGCSSSASTTISIPTENTVQLTYPSDNLYLLSNEKINFSWTDLPFDSLSTSYTIEIANDSLFSSLILSKTINSKNLDTIVSTLNGTYYWRVKRCYSSNWSQTRKFNLVNINLGQRLWLRSDSLEITNGKISKWFDKSGNGFHALQPIVNNQPILATASPLIAHSAVKFDGVDDFLNGSTIPGFNNSSLTAFIVVNGYDQTDNGGLLTVGSLNQGFGLYRGTLYQRFTMLSNYSSNNLVFDLPFTMPNSGYPFKIFGMTKNIGLNAQLHCNGASGVPNSTTTLVGAFTNANYQISGGELGRLKGEIAEVILYDQALSTEQRNLVERYLMDRYAPPVNLGEDINATYGFCDITLKPKNLIYKSYLWNNNDTTSSISINNPGTYWVQTVDVFGRISRDSIKVYRPIFDKVKLNDEAICYGQSELFSVQIPSGNYSFVQWSDGLTNPTRTINKPESLSFIIQDSLGCQRSSDTANIYIDSTLNNLTLGNDTSLCSGNTISLRNIPTGNLTYTWNTGNNLSNQEIDTSGTYILEVQNENGCSLNDTIEVVVVGVAPTLVYDFPLQICQGIQINFSDSTIVPSPNTITEIIWHFENKPDYFGKNGSMVFDSSGIYECELEVKTSGGCNNQKKFDLTVFPKPIISFSTINYCPNEMIEFVPENSTGIPISNYSWNIASGSFFSIESNPKYLFGVPGKFNAALNVIDINGCMDTTLQNVLIQEAPKVDFISSNTCVKQNTDFNNLSTISDSLGFLSFAWDFGDGSSSNSKDVSKVYLDTNIYAVQLIAVATNGCSDTVVKKININPLPMLAWTISPACKNTWTLFENNSTIQSGTIAETNWLVNLQYTYSGITSAYKFVTTGIQYVNLSSISDKGCKEDTLIIVNVHSEINAKYEVSPKTIAAGIPIVFSNLSTGGNSYEWNLGNNYVVQSNSLNSIEIPGYSNAFINDSILTSLAIQNTIGCKDTAYQFIKINEPRIDLGINQLFVQNINGFFKVGVELQNLGFIDIKQTGLQLKLYNSIPILETENESLAPGESRIYLFNASPSAFVSTQDNEISYLCVEAISYNDYQLIETELSNNIFCLNTEGGNFALLPIYPNPTNDDVTYTLIVSEESTIITSLTDETGRIVQSSNELYASGLHTPNLSMRNLSAGVYYFQISDGATSKTVKVLKN